MHAGNFYVPEQKCPCCEYEGNLELLLCVFRAYELGAGCAAQREVLSGFSERGLLVV